jgi:hypothetical protein
MNIITICKHQISEINSSLQILPVRPACVIQTINDIIKAHGGEIKVQTKEGQGSEFVIQLKV